MSGKANISGSNQTDRLSGLTLLQTAENGQQRNSIPNVNSGPPLRILSSRRGQQVPCVLLNTSVGAGLPQNVGQNVNTVINPTNETHRGGMHLLLVPTEQLVQQRVANVPRAISSTTNQPPIRIENSDITNNNTNPINPRNMTEPNTRFLSANNTNSNDYCLGVGAQNCAPHILESK